MCIRDRANALAQPARSGVRSCHTAKARARRSRSDRGAGRAGRTEHSKVPSSSWLAEPLVQLWSS
eukprot:4191860-Alexandrium_andersonii.AAC.1